MGYAILFPDLTQSKVDLFRASASTRALSPSYCSLTEPPRTGEKNFRSASLCAAKRKVLDPDETLLKAGFRKGEAPARKEKLF